MNVQRFIFWLRFPAVLILEVLGDQEPETAGSGAEEAPPVLGMKPERIQFWIGQLARFIAEIVEGASGETGKSGEREVEW